MTTRASILGLTAVLFFFAPTLALAQGGPPLITDDPGTPGNRNWEINIASIGQYSSSERYTQFPYFDLNYGLGERLQLKAEGGFGLSEDTGSTYHTGVGTLLVGVKWRFFDQDDVGVNISTYPQYNFHPFYSSTDPELVAPGNQVILPIELSKQFGKFWVNPEVGYESSTESPDLIFYGVVFAYEVVKDSEALFELHGNSFFGGQGTEFLFNVGTNWALGEKVSLLFSIGHTLETPFGEEAQLLSYLGVQLRL